MAPRLTERERYLRRVEALALSALPVTALPMVAAAPTHHDGVMVALVPDDPEQLALDHPEALPADDLHVTLCFLGKLQDLSSFDKTEILTKARRVCDELGHSFITNADGVVVMGENDDGVPATALLIQSDDIVKLYDAVAEALEYKSDYPSFIPHMTTGYGVPIEMAQERVGQPISFSNALVKFGDDKHIIPLTSSIVAAPQGANVIDRVIDSLGRLWDEALHPRDNKGRFIKKNGAVSGKLSVPTADKKSVNVVDANRASVVGFKTLGNEVWVLAEITNPDGSKVQGFAKATDVDAVAPIKARLDALYPIENDARGVPTVNSSLERKRQLDLLLAHINEKFGPGNKEGALEFLDTLGLWEKDVEYMTHGDDPDFTGGVRQVNHTLTPDEKDEVEDIINDARQVKELRERVHGLQSDTADSSIESVKDLMEKYDKLDVSSWVSEKSGSITLSRVVVKDQSQGTGSAFMQDLIDYADKVGKRVDLTPSSDFGGSKPRLVEFYKRFGFVENKGKNKDYEVSETMYRLPETLTEGVDIQRPAPDAPTKTQGGESAVDQLIAGADPFEVRSETLFDDMVASGRFKLDTPTAETGISQIHWFEDENDKTDHSAHLAGLHRKTTSRAYFVKESALGAEFDNSDIVREVLASLITEQVADATNGDERIILMPKSVIADNPIWDGVTPEEEEFIGESFLLKIHQPGKVISEHAAYLVPPDWEITDAATEMMRLNNDTKSVDIEIADDMIAAYNEDMGNLYGHSVAKMILFDFAILNSDRNGSNMAFAHSPDESEGTVIMIDHGNAFDQVPTDHRTGEDLEIDDHGEMFDWFMGYPYERGWLDFVRGGLRLNDRMTEASLRQAISDFADVYGNLNSNDIIAQFSAIPGITEAQIERVRSTIDGVVERIDYIAENQDAVFDGLTGVGQESVV